MLNNLIAFKQQEQIQQQQQQQVLKNQNNREKGTEIWLSNPSNQQQDGPSPSNPLHQIKWNQNETQLVNNTNETNNNNNNNSQQWTTQSPPILATGSTSQTFNSNLSLQTSKTPIEPTGWEDPDFKQAKKSMMELIFGEIQKFIKVLKYKNGVFILNNMYQIRPL